MTEERKALIDKFQKWLDTKPREQIIAAICANIAEEYAEQLLIQRVSCSFADKEILSNSLRFALTETPQDEQGALKDFKKYQALMRKCMLWLKDNYEPPCDGFMNECEA